MTVEKKNAMTYPFPCIHLLVGVDEGDIGQAAGMGVDNGAFGDEQSTRGARPLSIILMGKVSVNVVLVRPAPRHRTENDAMLEVHTTNADRLKEFRHYRHLEVDRW